MDEIKPHHWITSVGRMSRRKPPKQCQPAAYYDQQAIDSLRAEVERLAKLCNELGNDWVSEMEACKRAEAEAEKWRDTCRCLAELLPEELVKGLIDKTQPK